MKYYEKNRVKYEIIFKIYISYTLYGFKSPLYIYIYIHRIWYSLSAVAHAVGANRWYN